MEDRAAQTPAETLPQIESQSENRTEQVALLLTIHEGEDDEDEESHHNTYTSTCYLELHPPAAPAQKVEMSRLRSQGPFTVQKVPWLVLEVADNWHWSTVHLYTCQH